MPQSLRGMPGNFGNQQQQQQQGRSVSSRVPNGKLGNNTSGWGFGGALPMGSGGVGFQNQGRQMGSNVSFAQSLSGPQPAAPLDPSEFPSLSNNSQIPNANPATWSSGGARSMSGPVQRNQTTGASSQQGGQEDGFSSSSSRLPSGQQGAFRFGNQGNLQASSQLHSTSADDFPPLHGGGNGDMASDRGASLIASLGFGSQLGSSGGQAHSNRGNGLLNALSANSKTNSARSPTGIGGSNADQPHDAKRLSSGDNGRQKSAREDGLSKTLGTADGDSSASNRNSLGAIGLDGKVNEVDASTPEPVDPLNGMAAVDKWGIKGLRTLMNSYPDYHAMVVGMDPGSLGLDMASQETFSTQVYSLFDENPPRPTVSGSKFRLPDCYNVTNVQPIDSKIQSFNEETLFWIFYSCPTDVKQQMAAVELHSRNWRWHKKLHVWLTKDEHMTPQILGPAHERGYYIVWDTANWRKDRREFTLHYTDLDTSLSQGPVVS